MALPEKLKELRLQRGWTQLEVAKRSGLDRRYISYLEQPDNSEAHPSAEALLSLARAYNIKPEELYEAAGYIKGSRISPRPETPEEILDKLRLATPVSIPVYSDYPVHATHPTEVIEYVYLARPKTVGKHIEGYLVHGGCLTPQVNDGDVIIIDREGTINNGDIIACLIDNQLHVGRLRKIANELWLENNNGRTKFEDCQLAAPVIECIRRLK